MRPDPRRGARSRRRGSRRARAAPRPCSGPAAVRGAPHPRGHGQGQGMGQGVGSCSVSGRWADPPHAAACGGRVRGTGGAASPSALASWACFCEGGDWGNTLVVCRSPTAVKIHGVPCQRQHAGGVSARAMRPSRTSSFRFLPPFFFLLLRCAIPAPPRPRPPVARASPGARLSYHGRPRGMTDVPDRVCRFQTCDHCIGSSTQRRRR
jgi:hypothetical protein